MATTRLGPGGYPAAATGPGAITGSLAVTEADDTLASTGVVIVGGALAVTEANDTLSAAGGGLVTGALAVTEANDALSAAGGGVVAGALAVTEANDTLAAAAGPVAGAALAVTEANDTLIAAGGGIVGGALAVTEANDTLAATGSGLVTGALAATEADDALAATGTVVTPPILGSLAVTEDGDILFAIAVLGPVTGALAITEDDDVLTAAGHWIPQGPGTRFVTPYDEYTSFQGVPYAAGKLYFYAAGTSTPLDTFTNSTLSATHSHPIILDDRGSPGDVFLTSGAFYKVILFDAEDNQIWKRDQVSSSTPTSPPPPPTPPPPPVMSFFSRPSGGPNVLDQIAARPTAAYAFRKLSSAYEGSAIRVQRQDGTFKDIGFGTDGSLDTEDLLAFCEGTDCRLATWYDQSGNRRDLVPSASDYSQAAFIVTAGALSATMGSNNRISARFVAGFNTAYLQATGFPPVIGSTEGALWAVANAEAGGIGPAGSGTNFPWRNPVSLMGVGGDPTGTSAGLGFFGAGDLWNPPSFTGYRWHGNLASFTSMPAAPLSYVFGTDNIFTLRWKTTAATPTRANIGGGIPGTNSSKHVNSNTAPSGLSVLVIGNGGNPRFGLPFVGSIGEVLAFDKEPSLSDANKLGVNQANYYGELPWTLMKI